METLTFPTTAQFLGDSLGATVIGDGSRTVKGLSSLEQASSGTLTFLAHRKFLSQLEKLRDAVLLAPPELVRDDLPVTYLVVPDPQGAFARVADQLRARPRWSGVAPQAVVEEGASLAPGVSVGAFAFVSRGARIGRNSRIHPYAYVGPDVVIGEDCEVHVRVTLMPGVRVGNRVKIFPGSVLGSDGFGFFPDGNGGLREMPQVGFVEIEDDVRIGANCTIDRGTIECTRIGRGTKVDDQVHVGHNVQVGPGCVLCGQVGIAGSAILEEGVMMGGQAGLGDGVRVGRGARLGAQSGSTTNVAGDETYFLTPALPMRQVARVVKYMRKLPEIWTRLCALEERLGRDSHG